MYSIKVKNAMKELSKKEQVQLKDLSDAIKIDNATKEQGTLMIYNVKNVITAAVHNDNASPADYNNFIIIDEEGNRYVTGSEAFGRRLEEIIDDMEGEEFGLKCFRRPSKNYAGRDFLSCAVI